MGRELKKHIKKGFMTVTAWLCQNWVTRNHEKCPFICISQNIDQHSFTFADLSKEMEI